MEVNVKPLMIVMCGLPASGKSTYANGLDPDKFVVVSTDAIRKELNGSESDQANPQAVFDTAYERIDTALALGKCVCFDATNLKARNRKWLCKKYGDRAQMMCVYAPTSAEECIRRDAMRERVVGAEVINRMAGTMSAPSADEGFDFIMTLH
jgi:predicted kinase